MDKRFADINRSTVEEMLTLAIPTQTGAVAPLDSVPLPMEITEIVWDEIRE
jgi:hypothetical protein